MLVFFFQSPLSIYHISHQMSTAISSLTKNYISETIYQLFYQVVCLYQNLTIKIITSTPTFTRHIYTRQPTLFLCVCIIILIVSSLPLFVCLRVQRAGLFISYRNTGFVGQCDETNITYCILGYRVYRTIIIIKIVTSNTSDSSTVGAGINSMASTRYSNNLQLYTNNKKYSKEFSKKDCNSVFVVL